MVGAFLTKKGMEFQMKTDDQEKARWPIVRLVRGRDWSLDRSWREGLYGENSRVDQMKEPCRQGWQFWNQSGPGFGGLFVTEQPLSKPHNTGLKT